MSKYLETVELFNDTLNRIIKNGDEWKFFLNSAGFIDKYSFEDQVLIYAQKPNAVACADFDFWNNKMHCWVNKGAKGIALLGDSYNKLRYVFDVSDVYKKENISKFPYVFNYRDEHISSIIDVLSSRFGVALDNQDIIKSIYDISEFYVDYVFDDILEDYSVAGSMLESREDKNEILHEMMLSSVAFNVLNRLRVDLRDIDIFKFDNISLFNTQESLGFLGDLVQGISKDLFNEITKAIKKYNKDHNISENLVDNLDNVFYNKNVEQMFVSDELERRMENEDRIREEWGLSNSEDSIVRERNEASESLGQDETEILERESQLGIDSMEVSRNSFDEVSRGSRESREDVRESDERDEGERGSNREAQSRRSDGVGSQSEQHQEQSRRDRENGSDIHEELNEDNLEEFNQLSFFPSYEEQTGDIAIAVANDSNVDATAFNLSINEPLAEKIIRFYPVFSGYEFENKKYDYYQLALMGFSADYIANRIKDNLRGFELGFIEDNKKMSLAYDDLGLVIATGTSVYKTSDENVVNFSYKEIAEKIIDLCKNGKYLSSDDVSISIDKYRNLLAENISSNIRDLDEDFELPEFLKDRPYGYPVSTNWFREIIDNSEKRTDLITFLKSDDLKYRADREQNLSKLSDFIEQLERIDDFDNYLKFDEPKDDIEEISDFYISEDAIDSYVIPSHSYRLGEIYEAWKNGNKKEIDTIAKDIFKDWGSSNVNHLHSGYTKKQGLLLQQGEIMKPFDEVFFSWAKIGSRIVNILDNNPNDFISPEKLEEYYLDKKIKSFTNDNQDIINKIGEIEDSLFINKDDRYTNKTIIDYRYEATQKLINEVNNDSLETILQILENQQNDFKNKEDVWFSFKSHALQDIPLYANLFVNSEGDWNLQVYDYEENDEEGCVCTDQSLTLDKAIGVCLELAGYSQYSLETLNIIEEPDFELLQNKYNEIESSDEVENDNVLKLSDNYVEIPIEEKEPVREQIDRDLSVSPIITMEDGMLKEVESDDILEEVASSDNVLSKEELKEIDDISASNYVFEDNDIQKGSSKEKYRANIEAIKLLKKLESEDRNAKPEEQDVLAKYVGWGGLSDVFDDSKSLWQSEYVELKNLLTEDEYNSAKSSILDSHYTDPSIIKGIYSVLEEGGFKKGNVLEPSMGIGNFFGCMPESMRGSKLYGVELDDVSGRIAKKLFPNADIKITGLENTNFSSDFFDVAIGNVPFGEHTPYDPEFKNNKFLIHDYFFAKALDKVRPNGIVAFITSKGTLDKKSDSFRNYISERADLIGAIRLPNDAFKNAGTQVTSDIIFLQKRETPLINKPSWVDVIENNDMTINKYFIDNPDMVCGEMKLISGRFGAESACVSDGNFEEEFKKALDKISSKIKIDNTFEFEEYDDELEEDNKYIPAIEGVPNYSYAIVDDDVYYRENATMELQDLSDKRKDRVMRMIKIRECAYDVLNAQLNDDDILFVKKQKELNTLYDEFNEEYGYITSVGKTNLNETLFRNDYGYPLISSLEVFDEDGKFVSKAAIFSSKTISNVSIPDKVDSSYDALILSLNEKGKVSPSYMVEKVDKDWDVIVKELEGVIFKEPLTEEYVTAEEYLSGNVREKLKIAKEYAKNNDDYEINVTRLEEVQPEDLGAEDIEIRLGTRWLDPDLINQFMKEVFETPPRLFWGDIETHYSKYTDEWLIDGKSKDYNNSLTNFKFGTSDRNAYWILEDCLNFRDSNVYDRVIDENGKPKSVINKEKTAYAQQKQDVIHEAFSEWVFKDIERREELVREYNERFNSIRPREFDGEFLEFPSMNLDINLKDYQKNAVARMLFGGNTLLAHCVGAGKTFEMATACMESKRLGLNSKSLFVVPNHLTEQWGSEFLRLYPTAKILVATKKDFNPQNRKRFCSRIATGDYDAVIIGHSQFEKIPLSLERQISYTQNELNDILSALENYRYYSSNNYTKKQLEKTKKKLEAKLNKLNDIKQDNTVTFEQLGVDRLFVDESHNYKNLETYTKMNNVAGITTSESKKATDMLYKCHYLDEITGGRGVVFATGTPISNTLSEMFTNMRYLQDNTLKEMEIKTFDSWASSFAEKKVEMELAPEGNKYRPKTRLARFYNLPELISIFKECADIQTQDMLDLPIPKVKYEDIVLEASNFQKDFISSLSERADAVRNTKIDPTLDNMLKITTEGRKLALDERLINPDIEDDSNNKSTACADKAFEIWENTKDNRSTQLIFCDQGIPKNDGSFSVYEDIKNKLIEKGVPEEEIAFIHDANTEKQKEDLFSKVRSGKVRFLFGSTSKLGAGTNVQDKLIALHHVDVPWRPSDIEQQEGRIIRRGNENEEVQIYRYIKKGTFDSYSWQLLEKKQRFISQVMTSKVPVRSADDIDDATLSYAEVKALATSNPKIKEKMELDNDLQKLDIAYSNYLKDKYKLETEVAKTIPTSIKATDEYIKALEVDFDKSKLYTDRDNEDFAITINNTLYTDKKEGADALMNAIKTKGNDKQFNTIGYYKDFELQVAFDNFSKLKVINVQGECSHKFNPSDSELGTLTRIDNAITRIGDELEKARTRYSDLQNQLKQAKEQIAKPFEKEEELKTKRERLKQLELELSIESQDNEQEEEPLTDREVLDQIDENIDTINDLVEGDSPNKYKKWVKISDFDPLTAILMKGTEKVEVKTFDSKEKAEFYKFLIDNKFDYYTEFAFEPNGLFDLLSGDMYDVRFDVNRTSLGYYQVDIMISPKDNGVSYVNTGISSMVFQSPTQAEEFIDLISNSKFNNKIFGDSNNEKEFHKELISDVEKGEIIEEETLENDDRFNMYNEKDFVEDKNKIAIYQLNSSSQNLLGLELSKLNELNFDVDRANYDLIYVGDYNPDMNFNDLFKDNEITRPFEFKGHSISVSDIIVINDGVNISSHYVDDVGFKNLDNFISKSKFGNSIIIEDNNEITELEDTEQSIAQSFDTHVSEEVRRERLRASHDASYQHQDNYSEELAEEENKQLDDVSGFGGK